MGSERVGHDLATKHSTYCHYWNLPSINPSLIAGHWNSVMNILQELWITLGQVGSNWTQACRHSMTFLWVLTLAHVYLPSWQSSQIGIGNFCVSGWFEPWFETVRALTSSCLDPRQSFLSFRSHHFSPEFSITSWCVSWNSLWGPALQTHSTRTTQTSNIVLSFSDGFPLGLNYCKSCYLRKGINSASVFSFVKWRE